MAMECDLMSEIEVLQSIYLDELLVSRRDDGGWEVSLVLYPSTAEDSGSQFVRLTLTMTLDQQYPSSSPAISIHNPRGLSDDKLSSVQKCLRLEAQSSLGSPVLYQLIEKAKEILTESNIPHGNCVICLHGFKEGEAFTKTSCYHYFHRHCLGRYVSHSEDELRRREKELEEDKTRDGPDRQELSVVCPVCREPLTYDVDQLLSSPAPQLPELDEAAIGSSFQQKWCELRRILDRQRAKGGVIDPDEESNRFFIHINETPPTAEDGSLEEDVSVPPSAPSSSNPTRETGVPADQFAPGLSHHRGAQSHRLQNPARGQRRGGGARPHHRRSAPIAEHLDKLSLSSEAPIKARDHGNHGQQMLGQTECCHRKTGGSVEQRESLGSPDDRPACQAAPEPEWPEDAAGRRGRRGRRRDPHRPVPHNRTPGSAYNHWDKRAPRSRGGANNLYGRGAGHSRGFHPSVLEREGGGGEVL